MFVSLLEIKEIKELQRTWLFQAFYCLHFQCCLKRTGTTCKHSDSHFKITRGGAQNYYCNGAYRCLAAHSRYYIFFHFTASFTETGVLWEFDIVVIDLSTWKRLLLRSPSLFFSVALMHKEKSIFIYAPYIPICFPVVFWLNKRLFKIISKPSLWNVPSGSKKDLEGRRVLKDKKKENFFFFFKTKQTKSRYFVLNSITSNMKTASLGQE